ncbi:MAG: DUF4252 domain-containing protein [Sphingobacterium sp.]
MQSCIVKKGANMDFAKKSNLSQDAEIVSINVPGFLMKTFIRTEIKELQEDDPALALAVKKIKKIKLMTVSNNGKTNLYEQFSTYLENNDFDELVSIYSDGAKISINTKTKGDRIKTIMLGITDEDDYVFVDLKSNIDINELQNLIEHYQETKKEK